MKSEAAQVKLLKEGEIQAFNYFFEAYSHRLYAFGFKYMKSEVDAEGLVQEVFLKIWRNHERLDESKSFHAYIFTIAYNQIRKYFQHKFVFLDENLVMTAQQGDSATESSIAYQSVLDHISKLLEQLPARKQKIFNLSRFEGKSANEISQLLNISPKTVDNQVSEVIRFLRAHLKDSDLWIWLYFLLFLKG